MRIRPPALGALIRNRRTKPAFDQKSLAQKGGGVSHQWIVELVKGKPCAENRALAAHT